MANNYPINLEGLAPGGPDHGDVVTKDGEVLGTWHLDKGEPLEGYGDAPYSGTLTFTENFATEPKFSEQIAILDSRVEFGLAVQSLCRNIRYWHEEHGG